MDSMRVTLKKALRNYWRFLRVFIPVCLLRALLSGGFSSLSLDDIRSGSSVLAAVFIAMFGGAICYTITESWRRTDAGRSSSWALSGALTTGPLIMLAVATDPDMRGLLRDPTIWLFAFVLGAVTAYAYGRWWSDVPSGHD
jgi:uncharacterized membrane protein YraQ (UPF0718 family)